MIEQPDTTTVFSSKIPNQICDFTILQTNFELSIQIEVECSKVVSDEKCKFCFFKFTQFFYCILNKYNNSTVALPSIKNVVENVKPVYDSVNRIYRNCKSTHRQHVPCINCILDVQDEILEGLRIFLGYQWNPPLMFASVTIYLYRTLKFTWENCTLCIRFYLQIGGRFSYWIN